MTDRPTDDRVLEATVTLFLERGAGNFTLHDVATTAEVGVEDLLRDGHTVGTLTTEATTRAVDRPPECPDEGSLRADLIRIVTSSVELMQRHPRLQERLIEAMSSPAAIADAPDQERSRFEIYLPVFERAVERGELPADADPWACRELLSTVWWSQWQRGRTITVDDVPALVDVVLRGIAADCEHPV